MVVVLGASGYIGQAMVAALRARQVPHETLSRRKLDYTRFDVLADYLQRQRPRFLINAAGYTGKPNVDACELAKDETLLGNVVLPVGIGHACQAAGVPWGHVSSGCIYDGAKVVEGGQTRVERDLNQPEMRRLLSEHPDRVRGFTEDDEPNFTFDQPPSSFYSGTKALGERSLRGVERAYIWRLRMPFDEMDNGRNYLSKLQRYPKVYDNVNSLSHLGDFAGACLDLWERKAPFGIYNLTNPGFVTTRQVVDRIERHLRPAKKFEFWESDAEFYKHAARTPRSNCLLDVSKALAAGVRLRPVEEALDDALRRWRTGAGQA